MSNTAVELLDYLNDECPDVLNADGVRELIEVLIEMQAIDERIEELKAERKARKEQAALVVSGRMYSSVSNRGINPLKLASILYWLADAYLSGTEVLSPLGYKPNAPARKMVYPLTVAYCACDAPLTVETRSDLQSFRTDARRGRLFGRAYCDDCKKRQYEQGAKGRAEAEAQYRERLRDLKTMPYRDYLQSDEWKTTRRRALKRAQFRCQVCNKGESLNVHHRTYERRGEERNDDLLVLCQPCHEIFHRQGKLARAQ
jgi:5-methylcytosine-specific restriction endonuclease McrA